LTVRPGSWLRAFAQAAFAQAVIEMWTNVHF